jgi:mannonate dehydratase
MRMVFRWFGAGNDTVTLRQIRQIPGVEGIVWSLHHLPAGEEWPMDEILRVKREVEAHGFHIEVVESVNVHDDIKLGLPTRDRYIENYKRTIEKLAEVGVKTICYNFMPVFDWVRTDLYKPAPDGSTAMFFEKSKIMDMDPRELIARINENPEFTMPGWEPERLQHIAALFEAYRGMTEERLRENLRYFLEAIIPVAERCGIRMAIHPDDPPWSIFGLPRIVNNRENIRRILDMVDSPANGLTFCSGSLGTNPELDLPGMIYEFADRIPFVHLRNVKVFDNGDFMETSHRVTDGTVDMTGIVKALHDVGFKGYARPDHGRQIWDEYGRPGYGLYDRALGIMYLWGIWDSLERNRKGGAVNRDSDS